MQALDLEGDKILSTVREAPLKKMQGVFGHWAVEIEVQMGICCC